MTEAITLQTYVTAILLLESESIPSQAGSGCSPAAVSIKYSQQF